MNEGERSVQIVHGRGVVVKLISKMSSCIKVVLHAAIFRAASLATPLRDMLHESLQRVTPLATVKIDAKLAATNVAESRIGFYFSQRLQQLFLALQRVTPPLQQVSQVSQNGKTNLESLFLK